jgi:hypothetical protein
VNEGERVASSASAERLRNGEISNKIRLKRGKKEEEKREKSWTEQKQQRGGHDSRPGVEPPKRLVVG